MRITKARAVNGAIVLCLVGMGALGLVRAVDRVRETAASLKEQ